MWKNSLKAKVTVALVVSIALLDGIGYYVADRNFRETEIHNAREDSHSRVAAMAAVLEVRFQELVNEIDAAAEALSRGANLDDTTLDLGLKGYWAVMVLDANDTVLAEEGDAADDAGLREAMRATSPPAITRIYGEHGPWLLVGQRSYDLSHSVVGGLHQDFLSNTLLADIAISTDPVALVKPNGELLAARLGELSGDTHRAAPAAAIAASLEGQVHEDYLIQSANLITLDLAVAELVPLDRLDARAEVLSFRYFLISTVVLSISGLVTLGIVARSLKPLTDITRAAERLSRGDEDLGLEVKTRDEMQVLADVLNRSARDIAEARRRQEAFADSLRVAAQDFEVAVGGLSRSVGEAETPEEIARRLADAILLVTACRGAAVLRADEVLQARGPSAAADGQGQPSPEIQALVASDPEAFSWFVLGDADEQARVAVLPTEERPLTHAEARKIEILGAQAAFAFHRARATQSLRQAHDELDRSLRQKQIFVDILSHDLKNPLAVARGRAELMARKDPTIAEKAKAIQSSIDRATAIIEEAVIYSKLDGSRGLERPPADMAALAEEAANSLRPLAAERDISVVVDAPANFTFPANRLLVRAIENVLSNGIKWSPPNAEVRLRVEDAPDACRIHIIDHGPGIPPEDRPRIFARFERADRTGVKGTGLGLAIAKRVIELHAGTVSIGETPGGGATFTIELPRTASSPTQAPLPQGQATNPTGGHP